MYIPEFWCGFIAGAALATILIIAWACYSYRKDKSEKK